MSSGLSVYLTVALPPDDKVFESSWLNHRSKSCELPPPTIKTLVVFAAEAPVPCPFPEPSAANSAPDCSFTPCLPAGTASLTPEDEGEGFWRDGKGVAEDTGLSASSPVMPTNAGATELLKLSREMRSITSRPFTSLLNQRSWPRWTKSGASFEPGTSNRPMKSANSTPFFKTISSVPPPAKCSVTFATGSPSFLLSPQHG